MLLGCDSFFSVHGDCVGVGQISGELLVAVSPRSDGRPLRYRHWRKDGEKLMKGTGGRTGFHLEPKKGYAH